MKTIEWVRREIELACKNETEKCKANPYHQEGDEEYGILYYKAAGELMEVLEKQGHSGYSAITVCSIFERLVKGRPLTPITDEEDQWRKAYSFKKDPVKRYQHKRMGSLFKYVAPDGTVSYYDIDRIEAYDQHSVAFSTS